MNIIQSIRKGRSYIDKIVERVSDAEANDTIFFEQTEILDPSTGEVKEDIINRVDQILQNKGLTVVKRAMKECRNGNFRTFVGSLDYKPLTTSLE